VSPSPPYCDKHRLSIVERLKLFDQVCTAVQHAHTKGVIHRDLKPSNVLVSIQDDRPFAKVIDFGIAKATTSRLTERTLVTEIHQMVGTPLYMSPEQAEGSADIDTRTDIYSLGVMLYELLTGTTPFDRASLRAAALPELQRVIREVEPPRPSARLTQPEGTLADVALRRRMEPQRLARMVRGELDWIVMKAIDKERSRRYETANGLAMDIRRYLAGDPVLASPPSTWYRLRKSVRRNRAAVAAGALIALSLIAGIAAFALQARVARARAAELEQVSKFQADMLRQVDPAQAGKLLTDDVRSRLDSALARAGASEKERALVAAAFSEQWQRINATDAALGLIDRAILKPAVKAIEEQFKNQPAVEATLQQVLATRYREMGLFDSALSLQEQALSTRRLVLGPAHVRTVDSLGELGELLRAQGRLGQAEPLLRETLETRRRLLGPTHPDTLTSASRLASLMVAQGKLSEAESRYREVLNDRRRTLGSDHPDTLESISDLGATLQRQGKLSEAEPYYRELLEKIRRVRGEDDPFALRAIGDLGVLLQTLGRPAEAEPFYREVLEGRRRLLGNQHAHTLVAISNMGFLLESQGRLTEAEPYYRESLGTARRVLGTEHATTLIAIVNLGRLLITQGRHVESLELLAPIEPAARKAFTGDNVRRLGSLLLSLGKARAAAGDLATAEANLLEAHALLLKARGPKHQETRASAEALASFYAGRHKASPGHGYDAKAAEWKQKTAEIL
jgi:serine/threonine protein kinase